MSRTTARSIVLCGALLSILALTSAAAPQKTTAVSREATRQTAEREAPRLDKTAADLARAAELTARIKVTAAVAPSSAPEAAGKAAGGYDSAVAVAADKERRALYREALESWEEAARGGTPVQAALAYNEIGTLHLTMGDSEQAIEIFRRVDLAAVPAEQRFLYQFNRARALDLGGDAAAAWRDYLATLAAQPAFSPAADGAWALLAGAPDDDPVAAARAAELALLLLGQGQLATLPDLVWPAVERWGTAELFAVLARWWAAAPPGAGNGDAAGALPEEERRRLRRLAELGNPWQPLSAELLLAFDAAAFEAAAAAAAEGQLDPLWRLVAGFDSWSRAGQGPAVAALLTSLAEADHRGGALAPALGRSFVAWWIDRGNTEAAARCAAILHLRPELDPQSAVLDAVISDIFAAKGAAYAARDWRNILRMHLLLATIFEEREQWGPASDFRSALFQLEHALQAESELLQLDPDHPRSAGLHRRLAVAYQAVGVSEKAFDHYLLAADGFGALGRLDEGRGQLEAAKVLDLPATPQRQKQLIAASRRLDRMGL